MNECPLRLPWGFHGRNLLLYIQGDFISTTDHPACPHPTDFAIYYPEARQMCPSISACSKFSYIEHRTEITSAVR